MHRARHSVVLRTHVSHRTRHCNAHLTKSSNVQHPGSTAWARLIATKLNEMTRRYPQINVFNHVQLPIYTYILVIWYTKAVGMIGIL